MSTTTQINHIDEKLILLDKTADALPVHAAELSFIHADNVLSGCQLKLQISSALYQRIDAAELFHLRTELRGPVSRGAFQPETEIEITATLQPQLLTSLANRFPTPEAMARHLRELSQIHSAEGQPTEKSEEPAVANEPSPLLLTESWFALDVRQLQDSGETGYRTFWSYVPPTLLAQEITSNGQISKAMEQFSQQSEKADWSAAEAVISDTVYELFQNLEAWTEETIFPAAETAISDAADEITQALETWLEADQAADGADGIAEKPIYQAIIAFFSEDDWPFAKLQGSDTLQLAFQGEHGQWDCYALARDEQAQFIFYSVCPALADKDQRVAISELIARANYGLVPGNFELDFDSGEIRLKTSLDTTHLTIGPSTIKQLVYTNVTLMDHYFPSIMAVLEQAVSPADAIQIVEDSTSSD